MKSVSCSKETKGRLNGRYAHGAAVGGKLTGAYRSWLAMRQRCLDPGSYQFHRYGGRGIGICERWLIFKNFLEDMGERPVGLTLERNDNDGHYCKGNCSWATPRKQAANTRRSILLTYQGKTQCVSAWARELGIDGGTLRARFHRGLPVDQVLQKRLSYG